MPTDFYDCEVRYARSAWEWCPALIRLAPNDREQLFQALHARYCEAHRAYHNWRHITQCLRQLQHVDEPYDPVLWLALFYHDAIYEPIATDNEVRSCGFLSHQLGGKVIQSTLARAEWWIHATKTHEPVGWDPSSEVFLDIDLSILGQPSWVYRQYERAIRAEYSMVDWPAYRAGRLGILRSFRNRDRIYLTDKFHSLYHTQATDNLEWAIGRLERMGDVDSDDSDDRLPP